MGMIQALLDLVYPASSLCPGCGSSFFAYGAQGFCEDCYDQLELFPSWQSLDLPWRFVKAGAALGFFRGPLRQMVHRFKFRAERRLGLAFGHLLGAVAVESPYGALVDAVLPIPLHPERAWRRGFNQAAILAEGVAAVLGRPVLSHVLVRQRRTRQQAHLPEGERRDNVTGAFRLTDPAVVKGKELLLVDDVITTGATVDAAAAALHGGGAKAVYALGVAVASPRR